MFEFVYYISADLLQESFCHNLSKEVEFYPNGVVATFLKWTQLQPTQLSLYSSETNLGICVSFICIPIWFLIFIFVPSTW